MGIKTVGSFVYDSATAQAVAADGKITFSSNTLSNDCLAYDGQGGVQIKAPGLYIVAANFTATATAAGNVEVDMQKSGTNVPGARAVETAAAEGDEVSLAFFKPVTVSKSCASGSYATLDFVAPDATSFIVANVTVYKIA